MVQKRKPAKAKPKPGKVWVHKPPLPTARKKVNTRIVLMGIAAVVAVIVMSFIIGGCDRNKFNKLKGTIFGTAPTELVR